MNVVLPPIMKFHGKNKYLCTDEKPTYVDFLFFEFICKLRWITEDKVFAEYPAVKYYYDEMCALPNLKEHLSNP